MKEQTEAAIRNVASIDDEITKEMLDQAIDILRGEMAGRNDLVHVMKRRDVMKHLKIHRRTLDYYLEKGYLKRVYGGERKKALGVSRESFLQFMAQRVVASGGTCRTGGTMRPGASATRGT